MRWRAVFIFYILACLISWMVMIPLALNHHHLVLIYDEQNTKLGDILHSFGALGPAIAGIILIYSINAKKGIKNFLGSYSPRKIKISWWALAFSPLLLLLIAIPIDYFTAGRWFSVDDFIVEKQFANPVNLIVWVLPCLFYGFFEETGWRGFLLPYLQNRYSAFLSSAFLTCFWITWHIPSFFYRYQMEPAMFIGFTISLFTGAILLTYIFNTTRGSLLVVSIWHFLWDAVSVIDKNGNLSAIMSTCIMILAVLVMIRYKYKLSPLETTKLNYS